MHFGKGFVRQGCWILVAGGLHGREAIDFCRIGLHHAHSVQAGRLGTGRGEVLDVSGLLRWRTWWHTLIAESLAVLKSAEWLTLKSLVYSSVNRSALEDLSILAASVSFWDGLFTNEDNPPSLVNSLTCLLSMLIPWQASLLLTSETPK